MFGIDHYAISVSDADKSIQFYEIFGFDVIKDYETEDKSLRIVQMKKDGMIIEFFNYKEYDALPDFVENLGSDLKVLGSKHLGLNTKDLTTAAEYLVENGVLKEMPKINEGRLGRSYFFVKDPDGIFVEVIAVE